jgi:hypothetical protein
VDISSANTEASLRFHRFHERLNLSIKVQMIGLGLLADEIDQKAPAEELKEKLYRRKGWLWGGMPDWPNPDTIVLNARRDIGQAGVVRAFSAFDLFMDEIAADLARWTAFSKQDPAPASDADEEADRVARFYRSIGGTSAAVRFLWPIYLYFRFARDSIVHRDGVASRALVECYQDWTLANALSKWIKRTGEMTAPEVIPVTAGELIDINHRHAISASSVLRLIALDINRQALHLLGARGLVYLAACRTLLDDQPIVDISGYGSMLRAMNAILSDRYRVKKVSERATAEALRELAITKSCASRFFQIKKQSERER